MLKTFIEELQGTPSLPINWAKEDIIEAIDYLDDDELQELGEEIAELFYDEDDDEESLDEAKYFDKKSGQVNRDKKKDKSSKRKKAKERKKWYKRNKSKVKRKQKKHRRKVKVGSHKVTKHR